MYAILKNCIIICINGDGKTNFKQMNYFFSNRIRLNYPVIEILEYSQCLSVKNEQMTCCVFVTSFMIVPQIRPSAQTFKVVVVVGVVKSTRCKKRRFIIKINVLMRQQTRTKNVNDRFESVNQSWVIIHNVMMTRRKVYDVIFLMRPISFWLSLFRQRFINYFCYWRFG